MTSSEYKTVDQTIRKLADLAERLDGVNIGIERVTKQQAAIILWGLQQDLQVMRDRSASLFSGAEHLSAME